MWGSLEVQIAVVVEYRRMTEAVVVLGLEEECWNELEALVVEGEDHVLELEELEG